MGKKDALPPDPHTASASVGGFHAMLWGTIAVLTVYGAHHVRDEVDKSELLKDTFLREAVTQVMKAGDAVGLPALRKTSDGLRQAVNETYAVLVEDTPAVTETPVEPPPPLVIEAPGQLVHRKAPVKRRVLVIGASSIQFAMGVELERRLPQYEGVKVKRFGQLATGLTRPDFMDWPKKLESLAKRFKPDLIITNFGGNDAQSIPVDKYTKHPFPSKEWDDAYAGRVTELIDIGRRYGADTVMLGMPVMRSDKFTKKMVRLNRVMKQATEAAGALFVSTFEMASTPDGKYRKSLRYNGKTGLMRTSDGVHYRKLGAQYVVENVMQQIERQYILPPGEPDRARAERHEFDSEVLKRPVRYVAYVPSGADQKYDALFLLPDQNADWSTWPHFPHRRLQRLAHTHQRVLVVMDDNDNGWWVDGNAEGTAWAKMVTTELLRDVAQHLPVTEKLGIAGAGSGGHGALILALRKPDAFSSVSAWQPAWQLPDDLAEGSAKWSVVHQAKDQKTRLAIHLFGDAPATEVDALSQTGATVTTADAAGAWKEDLPKVVAWHAQVKTATPLAPPPKVAPPAKKPAPKKRRSRRRRTSRKRRKN